MVARRNAQSAPATTVTPAGTPEIQATREAMAEHLAHLGGHFEPDPDGEPNLWHWFTAHQPKPKVWLCEATPAGVRLLAQWRSENGAACPTPPTFLTMYDPQDSPHVGVWSLSPRPDLGPYMWSTSRVEGIVSVQAGGNVSDGGFYRQVGQERWWPLDTPED